MARQSAERWAAIVAEAEASGGSLSQVAARHRVSVPALKYQLSKVRKATAGAEESPRLLPVRVSDERATLEAQLGAIRLSFPEGCDPAYVAAVLTALRKACKASC